MKISSMINCHRIQVGVFSFVKPEKKREVVSLSITSLLHAMANAMQRNIPIIMTIHEKRWKDFMHSNHTRSIRCSYFFKLANVLLSVAIFTAYRRDWWRKPIKLFTVCRKWIHSQESCVHFELSVNTFAYQTLEHGRN